MSEPTLEQVFGTGASQDANQLVISKAALAAVGLTPTIDNTAESLFAAIHKIAINSLSAQNQTLNPDQHVSLQAANSTVFETAYGTRLRQNVLVGFDNPFINPGITPDDY